MIDWDRVLKDHGPMVWHTAYRLLSNEDDAQDCLQETFLSAVEMSRREPIRNWQATLRHLATWRALDRLRQRMRRDRDCDGVEMDELPHRQSDPLHEAQADELADRLRDALAELPPRQAEVFAMRFVEDMSYRDIADALGLKVAAVSVILHDARERLKTLLVDHGSRAES